MILTPHVPFTLDKVQRAVDRPDEFLSIQLDGTDQLPFGCPSFIQIYKKEGPQRIHFHELVAVIDNSSDREVLIFDSMEHIPHNPNMIIDALQKTLKHVEKRNGGVLPPTLYLQFDNCLRENKNAYMCAYLSMLIERGVFQRIFMSFLPVGHTHDIVDQVNSRLSVACRNVDIPSREDLIEIMKDSYTPEPKVIKLDKIADFKRLVNPNGDSHYRDAHIHEHSGILKPLHFCFEMDPAKRSSVKCKSTTDDEQWGTRFYSFRQHPIPIHVRDIEGNDFIVIAPERMQEMKRHIESVSWRACMNRPEVKEDIEACLATLEDPPTDFFWESNGEFTKESEGYDEIVADRLAYDELMESEEPRGVAPRRTHLHTSQYQRKKHKEKSVKAGDFVAVDVRGRGDYVARGPRFFIGTVRRIDRRSHECIVDWWNCSRGEFFTYKKFTAAGEKWATVNIDDIFVRFEKLKSTGRLTKSVETAIKAQLALPSGDRDSLFPADIDSDGVDEVVVDELSDFDDEEGEESSDDD